jgi:hypothetical protein
MTIRKGMKLMWGNYTLSIETVYDVSEDECRTYSKCRATADSEFFGWSYYHPRPELRQ